MYMGYMEKRLLARVQAQRGFGQMRAMAMSRAGYGPRPGIDRYQYGDGLFSWIGKTVGKILKPVAAIASFIPGIGGVAGKVLGFASKVLAPVASIAGGAAIATALTSPGTANVPATIPRGGLPALPGPSPAQGGGIGGAITNLLPWWKGPGGKLQFPWQDPKQILQPPYAYDDSYLRIQYRAPRGYVVVKDPQGRRYCMAKPVARSLGMWHQAHKPPISAGDWHKYMTARSVEKKLLKIARHALHKHHRTLQPVAHPHHRRAA
jgi:hypothetical protein